MASRDNLLNTEPGEQIGFNEPLAIPSALTSGNPAGQLRSILSVIPGLSQLLYEGPEAMGRVARGELDPISPEGIRAGFNAAAGAMTGGVPFAKPGSLGVFGGALARTADKRKLLDAMQLEINGAEPTHVWERTGWFRGADGEWKFEIPDTGAKIKPDAAKGETLGDILHHPELYRAYPELEGMSAAVRKKEGGAYYPDWKHIAVGTENIGSPETTLHEVQHAIQEIENFGRGGEPRYGNTEEQKERALQAYWALAGETESRNVEDRFGVHARFPQLGMYRTEDRPGIAPWETEDTPRAKQFVTKETVFATPWEYQASDGRRFAVHPQSGRVHELVPVQHNPFEGMPDE